MKYAVIFLMISDYQETFGQTKATAGKSSPDGLGTLTGAGRLIDKGILQLSKQSAFLWENAREAFEESKKPENTSYYSPYSERIFRPSVQHYMAAEEPAKLEVPALIAHGSFAYKADVADAELLKDARPNAELVILEGRIHNFKKIEGETLNTRKNRMNRHAPCPRI